MANQQDIFTPTQRMRGTGINRVIFLTIVIHLSPHRHREKGIVRNFLRPFSEKRNIGFIHAPFLLLLLLMPN
ncbi:hypothetical protein BED46_040595 [Burkholderia contaminans]|nr:hypothetical protein BED46_040595 [Burkholderia contaminans]